MVCLLLAASLPGAGPALSAKKEEKEGKDAKGAAPSAAARKKAQKLKTTAFEHYQAKRFDEALKAWKTAYEADPDPETLYYIGQAQWRSGSVDAAILTFEKFVRDNPEHDMRSEAEAKLQELILKTEEERASQAMAAGRYDEAQLSLQNLYKVRPRARTLLSLAEAQRMGGRLAEAIRSYERALREELSPAQREGAEKALGDLRSQHEAEQGAAHYAARQYEAAAQAYETAYKLRPATRLLLPMALAQRDAGRYGAALATFELFLKEERSGPRRKEVEAGLPDLRARALDERALELFREGKKEQAIATWEDAFRMKPIPAILFRLARAHRMAGHKEEALQFFEQCLRIKESLSIDERIETESAVVELRGTAPVKKWDRSLIEPRTYPIYRRPSFWAVMTVIAAGVGAGVGIGVAAATGLGARPASAQGFSPDLGSVTPMFQTQGNGP